MRVGLKTAIFATGKSQRQLAAAAGIPENRLSGIVRGWTEPRKAEREALMRALECGPEVFTRSTNDREARA